MRSFFSFSFAFAIPLTLEIIRPSAWHDYKHIDPGLSELRRDVYVDPTGTQRLSHQNPSFIGTVLNLKPVLARDYLRRELLPLHRLTLFAREELRQPHGWLETATRLANPRGCECALHHGRVDLDVC